MAHSMFELFASSAISRNISANMKISICLCIVLLSGLNCSDVSNDVDDLRAELGYFSEASNILGQLVEWYTEFIKGTEFDGKALSEARDKLDEMRAKIVQASGEARKHYPPELLPPRLRKLYLQIDAVLHQAATEVNKKQQEIDKEDEAYIELPPT